MSFDLLFFTAGPGDGSTDPHPNGVAGATHRYIVGRQGIAVGQPLLSLNDLIGSANLGAVGSVNPALVATEDGAVFASAQAGANFTLGATADLGAAFTVALVMRTTAVNPTGEAIFDGYRTKKGGTGDLYLAGDNGSGGTGLVTAISTPTDFAVVFLLCSSAASRIGVNAQISANAGTIAGPLASNNDKVQLGFSGVTAGQKLEYAEVNIWPSLLSAPDRASHEAAMRAKYGALIPA